MNNSLRQMRIALAVAALQNSGLFHAEAVPVAREPKPVMKDLDKTKGKES